MTIAGKLKSVLADGQFYDIAKIAELHGWKLHSAEAAARVLRRPKHGLFVERKRVEGRVLVRAVPRGLAAWLPSPAATTEAPFMGTNRDAPSALLEPSPKPKRKYTRRKLNARAIAREVIIDVLTRGVGRNARPA